MMSHHLQALLEQARLEGQKEKPVDIVLPQAKRRESVRDGLCVQPPFGCGKPATEFRDALSIKEYRISGLCQNCQDAIFKSGM